MNKKIHFLHIPKTAGQSVHQLLVDAFKTVSPLRLNAQYNELGIDSVRHYEVISGHIDWELMLSGGNADFTFTVLRDPIERILSFYHYLRQEAKKLDAFELEKPERIGMYNALHLSPDDYFCPDDLGFKRFIDDHYDNFYAYFFSTKTYLGNRDIRNVLSENEIVGQAVKNLSELDKIYTLNTVDRLPFDLKIKFPELNFDGLKHMNKGNAATTEERLNNLSVIGESEKAKTRIFEMCNLDYYIFNLINRV